MNHERYMRLALAAARQALERREFPVGCVLVGAGEVVATGSRRGTAAGRGNELDHAEMVALRRLTEAAGGPPPSPLIAYSTMEPCLMCLGALVLNGVSEIVFAYEDVMGGATGLDLAQAAPLYRDRRPRVVPHVLRAESLALFKAFFAEPANGYWRGSLLADYTLAQ